MASEVRSPAEWADDCAASSAAVGGFARLMRRQRLLASRELVVPRAPGDSPPNDRPQTTGQSRYRKASSLRASVWSLSGDDGSRLRTSTTEQLVSIASCYRASACGESPLVRAFGRTPTLYASEGKIRAGSVVRWAPPTGISIIRVDLFGTFDLIILLGKNFISTKKYKYKEEWILS